MASLSWFTYKTFLFLDTLSAIIFKIVYVLPLPRRPSTAKFSPLAAFSNICFWIILVGKIAFTVWKYSSFISFGVDSYIERSISNNPLPPLKSGYSTFAYVRKFPIWNSNFVFFAISNE